MSTYMEPAIVGYPYDHLYESCPELEKEKAAVGIQQRYIGTRSWLRIEPTSDIVCRECRLRYEDET